MITAAVAIISGIAATAVAHYRSRARLAWQQIRAAEARAEFTANQADARVNAALVEAESRIASTMSMAQARIAESDNQIRATRDRAAEQAKAARDSEQRRAAAMAAFAGAAGRMQAMSTSMLAELREMEHRHADPKVLADLLELDHRTAQAGRLADSIAVLSGARSGRRWAKPIAMESILRGAMGRVAGYQRVRLRAVADIAIAGHAAEGVMHTLAELLDNACNFSPPTTEVHVYAAEVPAGVVITIEDSGLVMSESALRRAEAAVARQQAASADLSSLSGTRLGLAVVGHLARKHDLTVSFRPSAIGGTAVVVVIPRDITTRVERTGTLSRIIPVASGQPAVGEPPVEAPAALEPAVPAAVIEHADPAAPGIADAPPTLDEIAAQAKTGLPKRRRGSTLATVHPDGLPALEQSETPRPAASPAALGAFQRAITGRNSSADAPGAPRPDTPSSPSASWKADL